MVEFGRNRRRVRCSVRSPLNLPPMKSIKSIAAVIAASLLIAGLAFAADTKAPAAKTAGCCTKAAADGKACAHGCCVEAAKGGDNCTKCGGAGKFAKKAEAKK